MGNVGWPQPKPKDSYGNPEPCAGDNLGLVVKQGPDCERENADPGETHDGSGCHVADPVPRTSGPAAIPRLGRRPVLQPQLFTGTRHRDVAVKPELL